MTAVEETAAEETAAEAFRDEVLQLGAHVPITELSLFAGRRLKRFPPCLLATTAASGEIGCVSMPVHVSITSAFGPLAQSLRVLDLSGNEMTQLPEALGDLTALVHLDVSRNFLRTLMPEAAPSQPSALTRLKSLEHLDAWSNCFRGLDALRLDALATLPQLRHFNVKFCPKIGAHGAGHTAFIEAKLGPGVAVAVTEQALAKEDKQHAADRDATQLRSQIEPHCIGVLRRRLALVYGETTNPDTTDREDVILRLVELGKGHPRAIRKIQGQKVEDSLCARLQGLMDEWVERDLLRRTRPGEVFRERTNIEAQHYMILKSPMAFDRADTKAAKAAANKGREHGELWRHAIAVLATVDAPFAETVTAIAFTKNFKGSPHIDTQNIGPFYGLALGDFKAPGGALCVEVSAREVAHVDTRHRLEKVDGRYPHWVAPYEGNRYSVIYYKTAGEVVTRTTAVFQGNDTPLVHDPETFPPMPADRYYNCYNAATGTYAPSDSVVVSRSSSAVGKGCEDTAIAAEPPCQPPFSTDDEI